MIISDYKMLNNESSCHRMRQSQHPTFGVNHSFAIKTRKKMKNFVDRHTESM